MDVINKLNSKYIMCQRNNISIILSKSLILWAILLMSETVYSKGLRCDTAYYPEMITLDYPFMNEIAQFIHTTSELKEIPPEINIPKKECFYLLDVRDLSNVKKDTDSKINFVENGSYSISLSYMITLPGIEISDLCTFSISGIRFLTHSNLNKYFVGCKVEKSQFVFPPGLVFWIFFEFEICSGKIVKATYIYEESSIESTQYDLINKRFIQNNKL